MSEFAHLVDQRLEFTPMYQQRQMTLFAIFPTTQRADRCDSSAASLMLLFPYSLHNIDHIVHPSVDGVPLVGEIDKASVIESNGDGTILYPIS